MGTSTRVGPLRATGARFDFRVTVERTAPTTASRSLQTSPDKAPIGYEAKDRKITVVEKDAELVRSIFRRYLELGSVNRLMVDLRQRGILTIAKSVKTGRTIGGIPFTRGPLYYLLRNRFYIGEVAYKGEILPGEQSAIVDRDLFDAVQTKLAEQQNNQTRARAKSEALLMGLIFDDRGNRMCPSYASKQGVRYRYYVSLPLLHGQPNPVGSVYRVPAAEVETVVSDAVRCEVPAATGLDHRELILRHVARIEVQSHKLLVELKTLAGPQPSEDDTDRKVIQIPWQKPPSKRKREIILPISDSSNDTRPIRADARARLVSAIARGRRWLDELVTAATDIDAIAGRERCSVRKVNMTISLAFLAPALVQAAIEGRLPRGIGIARLSDPVAEWSLQYQELGLPVP